MSSKTNGMAALVAMVVSATALGQGLIIIEPPPRPRPPRVIVPPVPQPVQLKELHVTATVQDNYAKTRIEQVFFNPNARQLEGTYLLPLPEDASVEQLSMWMNGKETSGELLDADAARKTYEDIVRSMRDPALLEYVGTRLVKARVFPIPANGDVKIAIEFSQTIAMQDGMGMYTLPTNKRGPVSDTIRDVSIDVTIESSHELASVFSPSHTVDVTRKSDHEARVSFEAKQYLPDQDFVVYYQAKEKAFGLSLLSYQSPGEDGFFMARIAPPWKVDKSKVMAKGICFVLDTSGSMAGEKIEQAKRALKYCLNNLNEQDTFNIITFATEPHAFQETLVPANKEYIEAALAKVDEIKAAGGTNINQALRQAIGSIPAAIAGQMRTFMIVFITDGEPTVDERDPDKILANVKEWVGKDGPRVFVFGVGHDLNAKLLDRLADENRGAREYIDENEDIELKVSRFASKVADPVLSNVQIDFGGAGVEKTYPKDLPDLFAGGELVVVGRYDKPGEHTVTVRGMSGETEYVFEYPATFASGRTKADFLPRLWATRRIGYLMDEVRLHGESSELKDEIVALAKRYGILTPYTSYLVTEDERRDLAAGRRVPLQPQVTDALSRLGYSQSNEAREEVRGYERQSVGRVAVRASREAGALKSQSVPPPAAPKPVGGESFGVQVGDGHAGGPLTRAIETVGEKTFYLNDDRWIDAAYDGVAETTKVTAFSDAYFALVHDHPELGKYLALGDHVIVMFEGVVYEIVGEESSASN